MPYKIIAFLGDSITQGYYDETGLGWAARLIQKLNARSPESYYHNNYAVSGDRIFDVWHRLCADVIPRQPDMLFIAVGLNDLIRWRVADAACNVPPEIREQFWTSVLTRAKMNIPLVFVHSILPVDEEKFPCQHGLGEFYLSNVDVAVYNNWLKDLCVKIGVNFLDFRPATADISVKDFLHPDGFHLSTAGHEQVAAWVYDLLIEQGI